MMKAVKLQSPQEVAQKKNEKVVATILMMAILMAPELAYAQPTGGNVIQQFINAVIAFLNSGVMRGIGILAVMSLGIAAYLGKISWELGMKIAAGLVFTFGAASLVDQFSGYASGS